MRNRGWFLAVLLIAVPSSSQDPTGWLADLTRPQDYVLKRVSSYDRTGRNADYRRMAPGETLTLLDSPIPFARTIRVTIEHGHANHRSDNFYSVGYWYQTEPHAPLPALPPVGDRLPRLYPVGGPGNAGK